MTNYDIDDYCYDAWVKHINGKSIVFSNELGIKFTILSTTNYSDVLKIVNYISTPALVYHVYDSLIESCQLDTYTEIVPLDYYSLAY